MGPVGHRHRLPWDRSLEGIYFDVHLLFQASERALRLLRAMVVWEDMANWQYANIYKGIAQTLAMAFLGTLLGTIGSLFVGFLAAKNVMPIRIVRQMVRRFLDVLRGNRPACLGPRLRPRRGPSGRWPGVLAIFISDLGTLSKLYSEAIENIDRKQVEGVRATGAGPFAVIRYGYLPQVLPVFIPQSLLISGESNTRSATILGIVGAGAIGMILIERFRAQLYDQVFFVVLNVLVLIFAIDWLSKRIRLWAIVKRATETAPRPKDGPCAKRGPFFFWSCNRRRRAARLAIMIIDGLQYANWSEKVFRQMREGGVDAVHVTIAYHEMFRETASRNIEAWNRWFERFPDLIRPAKKTGDDIRAAKAEGRTGHRLRRADARAHRGRYRGLV